MQQIYCVKYKVYLKKISFRKILQNRKYMKFCFALLRFAKFDRERIGIFLKLKQFHEYLRKLANISANDNQGLVAFKFRKSRVQKSHDTMLLKGL